MLVETTANASALYVYSNCIVDFFVSFFDSVVMLFTVKSSIGYQCRDLVS